MAIGIHNIISNRRKKMFLSIFLILNLFCTILFIYRPWESRINLDPSAEEHHPLILINQLGYLPIDPEKRVLYQLPIKEANSISNSSPLTFRVYLVNNDVYLANNDQLEEGNSLVFTGILEDLGDLWGYHYYKGDFTKLTAEGSYYIQIGDSFSYTFRIADDVYDISLERAYQFYYYQRTGCEVNEIVPGYPGHAACHLDDANEKENHNDPESWRNLTGGWFDAGDYNKYNYQKNTPLAVWSLITSYEENQEFFNTTVLKTQYKNSTGFYYSSNDVPDIVEEAIWGADYLVKCINVDGTIVGRVGSNDFQGWYGYWGMPEMETDNDNNTALDNRLYYENIWYSFMLSASLFKLYRILLENNWYIEKAQSYLKSAKFLYYMDTQVPSRVDGLKWRNNWDALHAAVEGYKSTGNLSYFEDANSFASQILKSNRISNPGFGHIGVDDLFSALFNWLSVNRSVDARKKVETAYESHWIHFWSPLFNSSRYSNFFNILRGKHTTFGEFYFWSNNFPGTSDWNVGQNSYYLCAAMAAFDGYKLTNNITYLNFGLRQLDWIMGINPFGLCMVESLGSYNPPSYHHRISADPRNPRGAIPGCVPNGIIRQLTNTNEIQPDEPWFDFQESYLESGTAEYSSNEPWQPHNSYFLLAVGSLLSL